MFLLLLFELVPSEPNDINKTRLIQVSRGNSSFCASRNICVLFVLLLYVPKSSTLAMARRSAHLITSFPGNLEEAVNQYFVMGARVLDSRPSGRGFEPHWWRCIAPLSKTHLS